MSKDFEAMKAGKSAIWPLLSCQYIENTFMDELWLCYILADLVRNRIYGALPKRLKRKFEPVQQNRGYELTALMCILCNKDY